MRDETSAPEMLRRAIAHIQATQDESGAWSRLHGEFPPESEPTSWAVKVLAMNGLAQERVEAGVQFMLHDQKTDGSWNNNAAHTGFAVVALQGALAFGNHDAVVRAMAYLRTVQQPDGGFQRTAGIGDATTLHTAIVLFAAKESGLGRDDPMVKKALTWLQSCHNKDGGYGVSVGTPSVGFGTARAVKALRIYGIPVSDPGVARGITWLLSMQQPSGGFSATGELPADPEITAYALTVLDGLNEYQKQIDKAISYLADAQCPDGSFESYAPIQFNNVSRKNTQTACFVAWALSEMNRAAVSTIEGVHKDTITEIRRG